ncbi:hypothetical protein LXL04_020236 [Taraxacum kok-saghyz]
MIENLRGMGLVLEAWSVESVVGKYHEESEREERGPMGWSEGGVTSQGGQGHYIIHLLNWPNRDNRAGCPGFDRFAYFNRLIHYKSGGVCGGAYGGPHHYDFIFVAFGLRNTIPGYSKNRRRSQVRPEVLEQKTITQGEGAQAV